MKKIAIILCAILCVACDEFPVKSLEMIPTELNLNVGEQTQIEVRLFPLEAARANVVVWSSSDESVATVSRKGVVTAIYSGTCVITAKVDNLEKTCQVTVNDLDYAFDFTRATALYYADAYETGTANCALRLLGDGISTDETGGMVGEGVFVNIDLNMPLGNQSVAAGNYVLGNEQRGEFTFSAGALKTEDNTQYATGTFVAQRTAEGLAVVFVKGGSMWIRKTDNGYRLEANLEGERNETIKLTFDGKIDVIDRSGDSQHETYAFATRSLSVDYLENSISSNFNAFRFTAADSDGTTLTFTLLVPLSVTQNCPDGIYEFSDSERAFSVASAEISIGGETHQITRGNVQISTTDGHQIVRCTFADRTGRAILGEFER